MLGLCGEARLPRKIQELSAENSENDPETVQKLFRISLPNAHTFQTIETLTFSSGIKMAPYKNVRAFKDAGSRAWRMKKAAKKYEVRRDKAWFAAKRAKQLKHEAEVFKAVKKAESEDELAKIAFSCAMYALKTS
jgi:DNA-directed RNA polymerase subunit K/omega